MVLRDNAAPDRVARDAAAVLGIVDVAPTRDEVDLRFASALNSPPPLLPCRPCASRFPPSAAGERIRLRRRAQCGMYGRLLGLGF